MIRFTKPADYYRFNKITLITGPMSGTHKARESRGVYIWNKRGFADGFDMLGYKLYAWAYRNRLVPWSHSIHSELDEIWRSWGHDSKNKVRAHRRSVLARQIANSFMFKGRYIEPSMRVINYGKWVA